MATINSSFVVKNGLVVNTSLLYAVNGQVGINTGAPDANLSVSGSANVSGNVWFGGTVTLRNALTLANTVTFSNAITFSNTITLTGNATFSNTLVVTGNTRLSNTLTVVGFSNLATISATNTSIAGTLSSGNTAITGTLTVSNGVTLSNTLGVTGATTLSNTLLLTGGATLSSTLALTGSATLSNTLNLVGNFIGSANASVAGNTTTGTLNSGNTRATSLIVGTGGTFGGTGEIRATNNVTAYYSSDQSLKVNVKPIPNALDKLKAISGVEFDWSDDYIKESGGEDGYFIRKHDVGVIAQEIEAVLPEVVATRGDGMKAVKYDRIVPLLIEAIKELSSKIEK